MIDSLGLFLGNKYTRCTTKLFPFNMSGTPDFIIRNGLRFVKPYYHVYRTTVKGRWFGKTALQVFTEEFRNYDGEHYLKRIMEDDISVIRRKNKQNIEFKGSILLDTPLKSGDVIVHREHIHEKPILNREIGIIHEDKDLLVVDKPSGIPMHPVQGYLYNSLTEALKSKLNILRLHPCNRLDKVTSGLVILCKNFESASFYQTMVQEREFRKEYIARVDGDFSHSPLVCRNDVLIIDTKKKAEGVKKRTAITRFKFLRYNSRLKQSIVSCIPETGRTHQIRIHLRDLGHPIINDWVYNPRYKRAFSRSAVESNLPKNLSEIQKEQDERRIAMYSGKTCSECGINLYKDPDPDSMVLFLHALKYTGHDRQGGIISYETGMPAWTNI